MVTCSSFFRGDFMKDKTIQEVLKFRDDRNWKPYNNPKDMAISISLEAAELLEVFQWSASDTQCLDKMDQIKEELADVMIYCIEMADVCGLDIDTIIHEKVLKNAEKYPVEPCKEGIDTYYALKEDYRTKHK